MSKVFTAKQAADICKVSTRTIARWFDSGRLRGYRVPGTQDRRIPYEHLLRFMKEHGMPLGALEDDRRRAEETTGAGNGADLGRVQAGAMPEAPDRGEC